MRFFCSMQYTWTWCSTQAIEGLGSEERDSSPFLDAHRGMAKGRLILGGLPISQVLFSSKGRSGQGRPEAVSHPGKEKW